jgi:membrane-bound lytic murein transglycosylase D
MSTQTGVLLAASVGLSLLLFLGIAPFAFIKGQQSTKKIDSLSQERIGFSTLFNITSTGNIDKPFEFQLNSKAVSFIQTYMDKQGPALIKMKTWAKPYFNLYDEILIANGVPVQLKYLSVIESHLSSNITSWAGAVGPWQLMPAEATRLGLKLNPNDERTDYHKSTQAAATILKELYAKYGDWLLVVAAYNGGAGRVSRAIEKVGSKDFWKIEYDLPLETRNHVKKFIATHYVFEGENASAFDKGDYVNKAFDKGDYVNKAFDNGNKVNKAKDKKNSSLLLQTQFQEVEVSGRFKISLIAKYLNIDPRALASLNPKFDQIVSSGKRYTLKLPMGYLEKFEAHKNDILQASLQSLYNIQE